MSLKFVLSFQLVYPGGVTLERQQTICINTTMHHYTRKASASFAFRDFIPILDSVIIITDDCFLFSLLLSTPKKPHTCNI